jgi:hypothetical protein
VIERDVQGNQVRFRANESYPIYEELRSILKKTTGVADQLRAALAPLTGILKLPKISVIGDSDELGELGEDRKAKTT